MTSNRRHAGNRPDPMRMARLQRDAGMERSRGITKGIAFGSVAAVAVAGVYLSQALPGHSATTSTGTGSSSAGTTAPTSSGGAPASSGSSSSGSSSSGAASSAGSAPSAPAYTPAPAYNQQPVVSSGSS